MRSRWLLPALVVLLTTVALWIACTQDDGPADRPAAEPPGESAVALTEPARGSAGRRRRQGRGGERQVGSEGPGRAARTRAPATSSADRPIARGPDGAPLANHSLLLRDTRTGNVYVSVTAADGGFVLPANLADATYHVTSVAPSGAGRVLGLAGPVRAEQLRAGDLRLRAQRGASITLRCVDHEGVRLQAVIEIRAGTEDAPAGRVRRVTTSSEHDTRISLPHDQRFVASLVRVPALDLTPVVRPVVALSTAAQEATVPVEFRVSRTAELTVSLVDGGGAPLPDVFVYSKADLPDGVQIQASGTTDAAGTVVLSKLHPGDVAVLVCIVGRPAVVERVGLQASERRRLEMTVPEGGVVVRGQLVGVPPADIAVVNLAYRSAPVMEAFTVSTKEIGPDGGFEFEGVKPGRYDLHVVLRDGAHGFRRMAMAEPINDLGALDISPFLETGELPVDVTASVPRWSRGYYNGQYRRDGWPAGLWRFVRLDDGNPTRLSLAEGTYAFRVTPESNATDGFRTAVQSGVDVRASAPVPHVKLTGSPLR